MVINRAELKTAAKQVLRGTYFTALIMGLILTFAGGSTGGTGSTTTIQRRLDSATETIVDSMYYSNPSIAFQALYAIFFVLLIIAGLAVLFRIFAGYHLEVGVQRYYIDTAQLQESGFGRLKYGFSYYGNILKTMLIRSVKIFLWSLLLIIPGIIKSYAYLMVPYILADNPNMDHKRALQLSNDMTMGHKMDIFVLELSFIGWRILGMLLFLVGIHLVNPYINATNAQLYLRLRDNAVNTGMVTPAELCLTPVTTPEYAN